MFSRWRSKRHFPSDSDSSSSAYPSSSQPASPLDSILCQREIRPMPSIGGSNGAGAGVKAFSGRVAIGSKGPKFRPGTREGSNGARSPISFAAGPRSSSRGGNSFEFGGGVVPDDSHSEAGRSDSSASRSSASPLSPPYTASRDGKPSTVSGRQTDRKAAPCSVHANGAQQQTKADGKDRHARLGSIDTVASFEDFRSFIAFSSPSNLLDESPALTTSTNLSSPDFAAKHKPLPVLMSNKPQPPTPTPVESESESQTIPPSSSSNINGSSNAPQSCPPPVKRVALKGSSTSADEPLHLRAQSNVAVQRPSTASSLPETVSQPRSSQLASEELRSPSRTTSNLADPMPRLEESIHDRQAGTAKFGLGIILPDDSQPTTNTATFRNSLNARRSTNTSSDLSSRSSADSWARSSFGRDALRMLIDSENSVQASHKTQKTHVSDSAHSTNSAETSTDVHDSDQLSTIKERTESPESVLKRQVSIESGLSQSDVPTQPTSASFARSDAYTTGSPQSRLSSTLGAPNSPGPADALRQSEKESTSLLSAQSQAGVNGIGSPTFGFRQRNSSSHPSTGNELLPPLDLDATSYSTDGRGGSSGSSTYSPKAPIDLAGLRPGSVGVLPTTPGLRLVAEPYTAPLPSLPFTASTSAPLLQASLSRSTTQSSEPKTSNLAYEAALTKAVGKQRKNRPAALALNLSALSAFPSNGSLMSPNNLTFKGLTSPGKPRPPPSAPPTQPLPPIPNTPSLAPKSPNPLQPSGSGNTTPPRSSVAVSDEADPLKTPKGSRSPSSANKVRNSKSSQSSPEHQSGSASISNGELLGVSAARRGSDVAKQAESELPAEIQSVQVAEPTVAIGAATSQVASSDSPELIASADERADNILTTIAAAQKLQRAAFRPVRYSIRRKEAGPKEDSSTPATKAASSNPPTDEVTSPITSTQPTDSISRGVTPMVKVEQQGPLPSPATSGQIVSFDVEPERRETQKQQKQLPQQSQTQPRHMTATEKLSRPPPSAWNARKTTSVAAHGGDFDSASITDSTVAANANASRSEMGHSELRDGATSVASCHSTFSSISDRRREILSDKEAPLGQLNESTRQEILKRTEGRFAGAFNEVAAAFRQLQADKLVLEQIVREKTPLSGVGTNNEQLSNYLSTMNAKHEHSNAEIRKLLALLEQQREVIEQLLATHQLEKETLEEDVERLHEALTEMENEAERNRDTIIRLNTELTRAHAATVQANAEAMRARTTLTEEGRKREKVVALLRLAKERLREVEAEDLSSSSSSSSSTSSPTSSSPTSSSPSQSSSSRVPGEGEKSEKDIELSTLRKILEERDAEIASLRLSHADAVMHESSTTTSSHSQSQFSETTSSSSSSSTTTSDTDEIVRLRNQISEQKEREKQIRTAYMYVRDELRKANTDRRRSSTLAPATAPSTSTARVSVFNGELQEVLSNAAMGGAGENVETPVKLKRLSLPIVARANGIHSAGDSVGIENEGGGGSGGYTAPWSFKGNQGGSRHGRRHSRQVVSRSSPTTQQ
ncbi:uncharacterized protein UBRO_20477 [Ustilago bromivora]|uniref:Uncharacterized protein n=1 Tax=Ustilago bromivora TaxID=307758 RepID=A0A1K0GY49_9BASI|nr:uncharacterized protein UBRO_20477 [Ustilago bromivora]SYW81343.1 uncharacterized protein UBRO2_04213 [Ustilago bromivora]